VVCIRSSPWELLAREESFERFSDIVYLEGRDGSGWMSVRSSIRNAFCGGAGAEPNDQQKSKYDGSSNRNALQKIEESVVQAHLRIIGAPQVFCDITKMLVRRVRTGGKTSCTWAFQAWQGEALFPLSREDALHGIERREEWRI
jgi:hypothetical protein